MREQWPACSGRNAKSGLWGDNGEAVDVVVQPHHLLWPVQRAVWPQAPARRNVGDKQMSEGPRREESMGGNLTTFLFRIAFWSLSVL